MHNYNTGRLGCKQQRRQRVLIEPGNSISHFLISLSLLIWCWISISQFTPSQMQFTLLLTASQDPLFLGPSDLKLRIENASNWTLPYRFQNGKYDIREFRLWGFQGSLTKLHVLISIPQFCSHSLSLKL